MKLRQLLNEHPWFQIDSVVPSALAFMRGRRIDLGFETMNLPKDAYRALVQGLEARGVATGTGHKLRVHQDSLVVEPANDVELTSLPPLWHHNVMVTDDDGSYMWVGKAFQQAKGITDDQLKGLGLKLSGGGWQRI